jgi:prepilin-type N-terminal cleavage/methylation domain-containing protein
MNNKGFTLIEILAVIIILGILAAFVVPKLVTLDKTANEVIAKAAIKELNTLELQIWTRQKFNADVQDDLIVAEAVSSISPACSFKHYSLTGGTLVCGNVEIILNRNISTRCCPGGWSN